MSEKKKPRKPDPEELEAERRAFWENARKQGDTVGALAEVLLPFEREQRIRVLRMVAIHFGLDDVDQDLRGARVR